MYKSTNKYLFWLIRFVILELYRIINSDDPTVRWVPGGQKFLILDPRKFSQTVLPKYFKHSKFTSFVRQLNFYGFHKKRIIATDLVNDDNVDATSDLGDAVCFQHEFFQRDQPKLLLRIQRTTKQTMAAAESPSQNKQKELEDLQEQMREMKKQIETSKDEFNIKLAAARAEIELDYLHRIQGIEVCFQNLVTMLLGNKKQQSSGFPLPKFPSPLTTGVSRSLSNSSRSDSAPTSTTAARNMILGQGFTPQDYLVRQKLDMLSQLHNNGSRRTLYDDLGAKAPTSVDALVGAATKHLKEKDAQAKLKHDLQVRASLNEILRRNKQLLAQYSTSNAAA